MARFYARKEGVNYLKAIEPLPRDSLLFTLKRATSRTLQR